jgi:hypothetical protein
MIESSNTLSLRRALDDLNVRYSVRESLQNGDGLTFSRYGDPGTGWVTMFFSSAELPFVRLYSTLDLALNDVDRLRTFEAINLANYQHVLDGVFDLNPEFQRIRFRETYRGEGRSLNPVEFPNAHWAHQSKVMLWNRVFREVLFASQPVARIIDDAVIKANRELLAANEEASKGQGVETLD